MARVLVIVPGSHRIDGVVHPVAVWRPEADFLAASTAVLGGGLGPRRWILNASVDADYRDPDPADHLSRIARAQGLDGDGIGLMTAVDVRDSHWAGDDGVEALATVGLGWPTWAAAGGRAGEQRRVEHGRHHQQRRLGPGGAERGGAGERGRHGHRGQGRRR